MGVLKVSPKTDRGLLETFEEHQCAAAAAACEVAATLNGSGLFLKKGGSELLFS